MPTYKFIFEKEAQKDVFGPVHARVWSGEAEGKHYWMQFFDENHARGVEDILFISMDGVSGLEEGARPVFKDTVVQRCIVHLIRNSVKYIPSKDYKAYTGQLKKVYGAVSLKAAEAESGRFKQMRRGVNIRGRGCMGEELGSCGTAVQLRKCCA